MPDPKAWALIRALFEEAMSLPAADRQGYLAGVTTSDAVRAEVMSLVAHAQGGSGLDEPVSMGTALGPGSAPTTLSSNSAAASALPSAPLAPAALKGERFGPWRTERLLGRGGMGEVWLAQRADGNFDGQAAIKVLRAGMDSAAVLGRFAQEQRALARLSHPHIARLLDAGRTADGRPFFVMEAVEGEPISKACEGLPLEQRLELFLQLADAVAYAHRQLLVHRDLKPSNVLVSSATEAAPACVKLLDFGIAKALDPLEGADASQTVAGERPFTPHFASPEQVRGEPVSTATDIYSLGVLLYVMLTGIRPYGRNATSPREAARSVLEETPTRPSALPPDLIADPKWMQTRRRLQGDLDNILLKALDKAVDSRYPSVDALAADIRAYLAGRPVSAQAPSWAYSASKFVRRNRLGMAMGALALACVLSAAGVALWQAHMASQQRDLAQLRFKQIHQLANQLVFKYHDEIENLPGATKAREALLKDAVGFLDGLAQSVQAGQSDLALAQDLAGAFYRISRLQGLDTSINTGQHGQAAQNLRKALAASEAYVNSPDLPLPALSLVISMHISHGEMLQRAGLMTQAEHALLMARPLVDRALARGPKDTWALSSALTLYGVHARLLGSNLSNATLGRWQEACRQADAARATADATLAADPANRYGPDSLAFTVGEQAQCQLLAGKPERAVALFKEQQALRDLMAERFADDMDFRYQQSIVRGNLARALAAAGDHDAARSAYADAVLRARKAAAADTGNQAAQRRIESLQVLELILDLEAGRKTQALERAKRLLPVARALPVEAFPEQRARAETWLWMARAVLPTEPTLAKDWLLEAAKSLPMPSGVDDDNATRRWLRAQILGEQARALAQTGDRTGAQSRAREALTLWQAPTPAEGPPPALRRWIEPLSAWAAP